MNRLRISTDNAELDIALIHRFLAEESTWSRNIGRDRVERAIAHSLCFGAYLDGGQVGFARVISDRATFANLVDVFVLPQWRGRGISRALMGAVLAHPDLQGLRRFTLATSTSRGLYEKFGFTSPARPDTLMERYFPDIYAPSCQG
ncbi:GNAT family N-acetyltransferase [Paludibacterium paludis]|uniref:N-acetyltransferase n=1 Tax=Paludibacterium paludis TaxID=1225769 RepID=A0A918U7Q2_9NEIS|nr:GNAT family N-acetyltransferase [Paludibacterium paludis]GGY06529.1 N-acetyltransferase [Paludibacterium paludis]